MNAVVAGIRAPEPEATQIATALARWYAEHSTIRRLWAIRNDVEVQVLVMLEPTSDGDDALPIWLANNRRWRSDLQQCLQREVQLLFAGTFSESPVNLDAVTIAEISWRDSWITP